MDDSDRTKKRDIKNVVLFLLEIMCLLFLSGCFRAGAANSDDFDSVGNSASIMETEQSVCRKNLSTGEITRSVTVIPVMKAKQPSQAVQPPETETQPQVTGIRFQPIFDIVVCGPETVGNLHYSNSKESTVDIVVQLYISDAELIEQGYDLVACKIRTEEELSAPDYSSANAYTVLFRSEKLLAGESIERCNVVFFPDGSRLNPGDYRILLRVDAYDRQTGVRLLVSVASESVLHVRV